MEEEKTSRQSVRLTDKLAREFKSACALEKVTAQEVLEKAVIEFLEKRKPE
jgi:metal-responsive CopG/Arc/MetJ family transcriptional regulator